MLGGDHFIPRENQVRTHHVVTCFLMHGGKVLILRRSERVGSYRGRWAAVAGYMEKEPYEQALQEIREEAGLEAEDVRLVAAGGTVEAADSQLDVTWIIHPFLFEIDDPAKVRLDWEHTECRWIEPAEIGQFDTVPKLKEALGKVLP